MNTIEIIEADLSNEAHQSAVLELINMYALDPMGGGKPLSPFVRENLVKGLRAHPTTLVFLALANGQPAGIAVCFLGFSTFAAKRLINIHDFAVNPGFRKDGIGRSMLKAIEDKAIEMGCCKLTLEVLESNRSAQSVYHSFGFNQGRPAKVGEGTLFLTKALG